MGKWMMWAMVGAAAVLLGSGAALADKTWTAVPANTDFESGANWVEASPPALDTVTDLAVFTGTVATQPLLTMARPVKGLRFTSGTWNVFGSGTTYQLDLGTYGVQNQGDATATIGASAVLGISGTTNFYTYNNDLVVKAKITGAGGINLEGTLKNNDQNSICLDGNNDFTGGVTLQTGAYVHVRNQNALGAKPGLVVTVPGSNGGQGSYAARLFLGSTAGSFASNVAEIIIDGEKTFRAQFYQYHGTTMSTKLMLNGGTYGFVNSGTGSRYNTGEIVLKAGTTSTITRGGYSYGDWYQTGVISGDGTLVHSGYNGADPRIYLDGDNTYTGGTYMSLTSNQPQGYVGHNNAFGTGPVELQTDLDTKTVFILSKSLEMPNAFRGRGNISTGAYVLTTTGSIAPRDTGVGAVPTVKNIGTTYIEDLKFGSDTDGCAYYWQYNATTSDLLSLTTLSFGKTTHLLDIDWLGTPGSPAAGDYVLMSYGGSDPDMTGVSWTFNTPVGPSGNLLAKVWVDNNANKVMVTLEAPLVPEPASIGLLLLGLPLIVRRRSRLTCSQPLPHSGRKECRMGKWMMWAMVGAATLLLGSGAALADKTWTGTSGTDFEDGGNWGGTAPANDSTTDVAIFTGTVPANQPELTLAERAVKGLQFGGGGWTLFDSSGSNVLELGSYGIYDNTTSTNTVGASGNSVLKITTATNVQSRGNLYVRSKITGTGGLNFDGLQNDGNQGAMYLYGNNDFTGDVQFTGNGAYVAVCHSNALGAKADLVVRVIDQSGYQSSGACRVYLLSPATDFASNVKEIIIEGEATYAAQFYQGAGTSISNTKITLEGGTYAFTGGGSKTNSAEIALKAGTTSYIDRSGGQGTWYQTGQITGDGRLFVMGYNANDTTVVFRGNNTYTGGTRLQSEGYGENNRTKAGSNTAFGTGAVWLDGVPGYPQALWLEASLQMANAFRGKGTVQTDNYRLTTTGSIAPYDTGYGAVGTSAIGTLTIEDLTLGSATDGCELIWDYNATSNDLLACTTLVFGAAAPTLTVNWLGVGEPAVGDYELMRYTNTLTAADMPDWIIGSTPVGLTGPLSAEVWLDAAGKKVMVTLEAPLVPEPASLGLLFLGLPLVVRRRR